jgi:chondroitin AC lyase
MKKKIYSGLIGWILVGCAPSELRYEVQSVGPGEIVLDGKNEEESWRGIKRIVNFENSWNRSISPATSLQLCRDGEMLYFYFDVADEEVLLENDFSTERDVEKEDRVELFLSKDSGMKEYYCFEIDAKGRALTYAASHYRKMDYDWEAPEGFEVRTTSHSEGYSVEGKIPLSFIRDLLSDGVLFLGAYRAEFSKDGAETVENWLTWVDPQTEAPDFHVPTSLGQVVFK